MHTVTHKEVCKLTINGRRKEGTLLYTSTNRIFFQFGYWKSLNEEIRNMEGRHYHGYDEKNPVKMWSIPNTQRNQFQLDFLKGKNPYAIYDAPLPDLKSDRPLRQHQFLMLNHMVGRRRSIVAGDMGVGKTLAAIEAAEHIFESEIAQALKLYPNDFKDSPVPFRERFWYVGPLSALIAVKGQFVEWQAKILPRFLTYEELVRTIDTWEEGAKAPKLVIFDESSKLKTPTSQRSQAGLQLANGVREDWLDDSFVVEMSGTPSPNKPTDWWHQCEVACPGFLVEGNIHTFMKRLGVVIDRENPHTGGVYNHLVAWKDSNTRCEACGAESKDKCQKSKDDPMVQMMGTCTDYKPCKNEVAYLYERMKGLVLVVKKEDCLDLPEKQYRIINCEPTPSTLRAAKLISKSAPTTINALIRLRELSDGFQYITEKTGGYTPCLECHATGKVSIERLAEDEIQGQVDFTCPLCNGAKEIPIEQRTVKEATCPKIDKLAELIEEHEEIGRLVVYAGFTASIDRIVNLALSKKWKVIRVDGRGWHGFDFDDFKVDNALKIFQKLKEEYPRVLFVGHPGSAGMGLTLTASPTIVYYSNDFSAESRIQSEDRIHRMGMDINRGATIIDLIHLPTDGHVLDNLKKKRELQAMSLGRIQDAYENVAT